MSTQIVKRATAQERAVALAIYVKEHPAAGISDRNVRMLYRRKDMGEFSLTTCARDLDTLCHTEDAGVIGVGINGAKMRYYMRGQSPMCAKSKADE